MGQVRRMNKGPQWGIAPEGWRDSGPDEGWQHHSVVEAMRHHWPRWQAVVRSNSPLAVLPLAPDRSTAFGHNLSMTFGYVVARAAFGKTRLSVLDWGGAIGHYALMARALVPELPIEVTVKELPVLAKAGQALQSDVNFVDNDFDAFSRQYDLVVASGSLQYAKDWRDIAVRLAKASTQWLFITRLPLVRWSGNFVAVQRSPQVLQSETISWVLNRADFLAHMVTLGLALEREFVTGDVIQHDGAFERAEYLGFLFRRSHD